MAVDDLVDAGWSVEGPTLDQDGVTRVRISRAFANADEASTIFAQIAGEDGPFQDFAVEKDTSFAESRWRFTGRVDFSGGLEAFEQTLGPVNQVQSEWHAYVRQLKTLLSQGASTQK